VDAVTAGKSLASRKKWMRLVCSRKLSLAFLGMEAPCHAFGASVTTRWTQPPKIRQVVWETQESLVENRVGPLG
jgi:hypothetical protein